MRYAVYEASPFGADKLAAQLEAGNDREALKRAQMLLPDVPGELRADDRIVCRFGRAGSFMLRR
jgi:hypothetical protein